MKLKKRHIANYSFLQTLEGDLISSSCVVVTGTDDDLAFSVRDAWVKVLKKDRKPVGANIEADRFSLYFEVMTGKLSFVSGNRHPSFFCAGHWGERWQVESSSNFFISPESQVLIRMEWEGC